MTLPPLGSMLHAFFEDHLRIQKGLRPASVKSYRDALRLFLLFVAKDTHRKITKLSLIDLTFDRALRFLKHLETDRHNNIGTRNHRLAALNTFYEYIATNVPEMLSEAERVAAIPTKRASPPATYFLERDEIDALFAGLPSEGRLSLRDKVLLLFLYNTGARVQEVAELCVQNLDIGTHPIVHLHGKGDKWRTCPLWTETANLIGQLLNERATALMPNAPVFTSRNGESLTRFGIYKIVRRHTGQMTSTDPNIKLRRVSPHIFRHYSASRTMPSDLGGQWRSGGNCCSKHS